MALLLAYLGEKENQHIQPVQESGEFVLVIQKQQE
jgi:hypothetical protein